MPSRKRPDDPRVSLVIPAKNEAHNLEVLLPDLPDVHETLLVDGNSTDGTVDIARAIRPDIRVVQQTRKGKGNALACGFEAATGDVIVMFDADCSADPREIARFVDVLVAGADFAKGSRFHPGGGSADITRLRAAGYRALNVIANRMMRARYTDLCYGYNAFWVDILPALDLPSTDIATMDGAATTGAPDNGAPANGAPANGESSSDGGMLWGDGFEIETVINCRIAAAGLQIVEVPSYELLRVFGDSNLNAMTDGLRVLKTIGTERRRVGRLKALRRREAVQRAEEYMSRRGWLRDSARADRYRDIA